MSFTFENLNVYQKSVDLAEKLSNLTDTFPKEHYYLVDQINRAALSVAANLAEGNGKWFPLDKKHYFRLAQGSAQGCVPIMEIAKRKGLINPDDLVQLNSELESICKMIAGLVKGLDAAKDKAKSGQVPPTVQAVKPPQPSTQVPTMPKPPQTYRTPSQGLHASKTAGSISAAK